jgi:hypothetical protein
MLRTELQGCLARVHSFLVRVRADFGMDPVALRVSLSELHISSMDNEEMCLYGCLSPHARVCLLPQPVVPAAYASYHDEDHS